MSQLLGNNVVEATAVNGSEGQAVACKFVAEGTGTVAEIQVRTGSGAMTGVTGMEIGIWEDSGGKPGALLGAVRIEGKPAKEKWIVASGLSVAVTNGTTYWLGAMGLGGTLSLVGKTGGTSGERKSLTGKVFAKLSEATEWNAALTKAPMSMFASSSPSGSPVVNGGGGISSSGARTGTGSPKLNSGGGIRAEGHLTGAGTVKLNGGGGPIATGARTGTGAPKLNGGGGLIVEGPPLLLIGRETEPEGVPGTFAGPGAGKPGTFRYQAVETGLVKTLHVHLGAAPSATSIRVAVREDVAGEPGSVLSEAGISGPFVEGTLTVAGLNAQVIAGRFYWLSVMPLGGTIKLKVTKPTEPGHTPSRKGKNVVALISEETEWEADTSEGPMLFYGTGVRTPKGSSQLNGGGGIHTTGQKLGTGPVALNGGGGVQIEGRAPFRGRPVLNGGGGTSATGARTGTGRPALNGGGGPTIVGNGPNAKTVNYITGEPFPIVEKGLGEEPEIAGQTFLQAYTAQKAGSPIIFCVHPGGGVQGWPVEYKNMREAATQFQKGPVKSQPAEKGAAVVYEYHLATTSEGWFPTALENSIAAFKWMLEHLAELNASRDKIYVLGASAGCGLAELMVEELAKEGIQVAGLIELSPYSPDWRLLTEEAEAANEAGEATGPLYNASMEGDTALLHHIQEVLHQKFPVGVGGRLNTVTGTALTNDPASRTYQDEWSPAHRQVYSTAKRLIISSETEVIAPRQPQKWQEHLIAEGKWDSRCKRRLRTASKTELHENGYEEVAINGGKGHALAYLSESQEWPTVLSFIFTPEGNPHLNGGGGIRATGTRITKGGAVALNSGGGISATGGRGTTVKLNSGGGIRTLRTSGREDQVAINGAGGITAATTRTGTVTINGGGGMVTFGIGKLQGRVKLNGGGGIMASASFSLTFTLAIDASDRGLVTVEVPER